MKLLTLLALSGLLFGQQMNTARMINGVNIQTGSSYTFVPADTARITSFNNISGINVSLPSGDTPGFQAGSVISVQNLGVGTVVITCSGCLINGAASLTLTTGQFADIYSNGLSYYSNSGNATPSTQNALGFQAVPPALLIQTFAPDPSGVCPYLTNVLASGQIQICNTGMGLSINDGSGNKLITETVNNGTAAMTTGAIGAGACGATVTVAAFGVLSTDVIAWSYAAPVAANPGQLVLNSWPTSNNVNFNFCNPSAGSITPTATTINWRTIR